MTTTAALIARIQNMRRVVIESPCAANAEHGFSMEDHADYLQEALEDSIKRNEAPIASHGLFAFTDFFNDSNPDERADCMVAGWAWLPQAHAVVAYCDLGISAGMQKGIDLALSMGIPVFYRYLREGEGFPHGPRPRGTFTAPRT
jgi:hypothetical protein